MYAIRSYYAGNCKSDDYSTSVEGITEPTLITADLGRKSLGAVFLDVEAPEGAVIDSYNFV